ncbi:uncharacterized protein LOC101864447 [Aplysia californica]|uniref:Uncharacterized protein LOC101864447 n=1 Tax=Aplysia californica TaxID=6500 RepID=A0ABM0JIZ5_APLCA|nr:uncharacterized protein LOC101864447 [Aplysia californica]
MLRQPLRACLHLAPVLWIVVGLSLRTSAVASVLHGMKPFWINTNELGFESKSRDQRWADEAYNFLHNIDCEHVTFTGTKECERLTNFPKESMTVYLAPSSSYGRYVSSIPDERLLRGEPHDAVLVLDPYPEMSFGHVVLVFFVDVGISRAACQKKEGIYLDHDECMHLVSRRRCRNLLERRSRRRNFAKRCEINFLPTVHLDTDRTLPKHNQLACKPDLMGFHQCPQLRPLNDTSRLLCDPLKENTQTCATTHETVRTSCRIFEICDQAVLVFGGWNRLTSHVSNEENIKGMYQLLRRNGFKRRNIKLFYANGVKEFQIEREPRQTAHPAAMKLALRYHLQRMCASPHCVDSLALYLNGPATHHGNMLLWDVNFNGMAEEEERYTVEELLSDLADCAARQVFLLVDQSYSGEISHALRSSTSHENVLVISSGKGFQYSYNSELTRYWSGQNDTRACVTDIYKSSLDFIEKSTPLMSNPGKVEKTLSGAPCDVTPPFSNRELRRDYFGCQNLPTAVWLREILRQSDDDIPEIPDA